MILKSEFTLAVAIALPATTMHSVHAELGAESLLMLLRAKLIMFGCSEYFSFIVAVK